ncbi:hypothetical protein LCM20_13145 [Halobacillus litoralis]|uniref:hypothetical protein n=1 Tax=Halobacillus litoralis TaxID=45668 RepID=UPI001CD413B8|nr:hypothetical protein [Halobacillus litoralis]MCA0971546.1 hypothetical protein [Halobacillus litoralis]
MKRNLLIIMLGLLVAVLAACSGDEVKDASSLETSDQEEVNKENASKDQDTATEDNENEDQDQESGDSSASNGEGTSSSENKGSSEGSTTSEGDASTEGSDGSGTSGTTASAAEDKGVNGTPRSEEEKQQASKYTFTEVKGNAVNVIQGVAAAEIKLGNIPQASASANIYMVADGQTIDLTYDKERDAFRNIQIKGIEVAKLQQAEVFVNS